MMGNPWAGEVALIIDGQPHVMRLTLGALAELEAGLAAGSLFELVERFEGGGFSSRDVLALLVAGLRGGGWSGQAQDLMSAQIEGGPIGASKAAAELLTRAFSLPQSDGAPSDGPKGNGLSREESQMDQVAPFGSAGGQVDQRDQQPGLNVRHGPQSGLHRVSKTYPDPRPNKMSERSIRNRSEFGPGHQPEGGLGYGSDEGRVHGENPRTALPPTPEAEHPLEPGPRHGPSHRSTNGPTHGPEHGPEQGTTLGPEHGLKHGPEDGPTHGLKHWPEDGPENGKNPAQKNTSDHAPARSGVSETGPRRDLPDSQCDWPDRNDEF